MDESLMLEGVQQLIHKVCWGLARKLELSEEELFGEAQIIAIEATRKYKPELCPYPVWIKRVVSQKLYQKAKYGTFKRLCSNPSTQEREEKEAPSSFNLNKFMDEISRDAATAVRLCIYFIPSSKKNMHKILKELGWPVRRITKCFGEVREALYGN